MTKFYKIIRSIARLPVNIVFLCISILSFTISICLFFFKCKDLNVYLDNINIAYYYIFKGYKLTDMQDTYNYDILSKFESSIDGVLLFSMILVVICICVFIAIVVSKFIYIV